MIPPGRVNCLTTFMKLCLEGIKAFEFVEIHSEPPHGDTQSFGGFVTITAGVNPPAANRSLGPLRTMNSYVWAKITEAVEMNNMKHNINVRNGNFTRSP